MTFYYEKKALALEAGQAYESHWDCKAELEPNNGWVIILMPKTLEVFKWPLYDLLDHVEIEVGGGRIAKKPANHKRVEPVPKITSSDGTPRTGATARVHAIADKIAPKSRDERAKIIDACVADGINKSTAATQLAKWFKKHGM